MAIVSQTYRDVVQQFREICSNHPAIETFRVGPPSMIEIPTQDQPVSAKYPYVQLVPQPAQLDSRTITFEFDLVVMDLAKDSLDLEERVHSSTLEIMRDIIASYVNTTWQTVNYNILLPSTVSPFVEGYLNSVAGWTAQITVEALAPLDNCNNPIQL